TIDPRDGDAMFVDGGNAAILATSHLEVHLVRVAAVRRGGHRKVVVREFFVLVRRQEHDCALQCIPKQDLPSAIVADSMDQAVQRVRRLCELSMCRHGEGVLVVLDGSLDQQDDEKDVSIDGLQIIGLSKTTQRGGDRPLAHTLLGAGPSAAWFYPETQFGGFVKLHPRSIHVFRVEFRGVEVHHALGVLLKESADPVFLGYPYGLIEADRRARVSKEEVKYLRTRLLNKIHGKDIEAALSTRDAHDILDTVA
ncbi:MAG: hypothetical protein ABIH41_06315, partial [Nanoarchaeota archaeon]